MCDARLVTIEEYKYLRQEHENNRKFGFERPLVIVAGMLAAAVSFKGQHLAVLALLPIPFLAMLWFSIWFTFNRVQNSARIVSYILLFHETQGTSNWVGWETSLRQFRQWVKKSGNY
jgi:hypothetical protein